MRGGLAGPRVLLRRIREIMAEPLGAQDRLDKIVVQIASNVVAEVCSVYILRADDVLELYATEGLNRDAVHQTSLSVGEGLVGLIAAQARPLNLSDAQSHPGFAYRPETGEENYHSFLGVPILRAGRTLGVLVVQNKASRSYYDEEEEALQTVAMVLAEIVASGELELLSRDGAELNLSQPLHLEGLSMAEGIGLGHVVLHDPRVIVHELIADDLEAEAVRLDEAVKLLRLSIDDLLLRDDVAKGGEHRDILEAYRMFAYDRGWVRRMREAVRTGLTAEAAVERVQNDMRARMMRSTDPYLRERLHDFDDLANRLLRSLLGEQSAVSPENLPKDAIIVARNMGAAELLDYERGNVRGLVLEEGTHTSHVVIVAKALGIPTVGMVQEATSLVENGDAAIVDAESGQIHLRPAADMQSAYGEKVRFRARRQEQYRLLRDEAAITLDGVNIGLQMNAGLLVDLPHLQEAGCDGIGLFRTELQFMVSATLPRKNQQEQIYSAVLDAADGKPVTFRSLDVGGDKILPFISLAQEENPAMGWRAIRLGLDRPGLLRLQLRALLHAASGRHLKIMFPMIASLDEIRDAKELLNREILQLERHNRKMPDVLEVGIMLEVPALLFQLDELMDMVDFVSVGSNDLYQFLFAVDRGNTRISKRFGHLPGSFARTLKQIVDAGKRSGKPVTLCGELAGTPLGAMGLLALGYRSISMSPSSIGPVKAMILSLDLQKVTDFMDGCMKSDIESGDLLDLLQDFANQNNVAI
ncbi:MAG: phosphoenolpyruvate--protein phosphotransferase [Cohaesibacteraceae bacterium]|nr:phosphoenolpyruvate--protein phosphotransferase [Cohaesibacteraceae bacterium]